MSNIPSKLQERSRIIQKALDDQEPLRDRMRINADNPTLEGIQENIRLWRQYMEIQQQLIADLKKLDSE